MVDGDGSNVELSTCMLQLYVVMVTLELLVNQRMT